MLGCLSWMRDSHPDLSERAIPIGYDTRFLSHDFAQLAHAVLMDQGQRCVLATRACPSPYLSYATHSLEAPLGLQFTASHNPWNYGGIKLKGSHGGSMLPEEVLLIEQFANQVDDGQVARYSLARPSGPPQEFNLEQEYRAAVLKAAGWRGDSGRHIIVDYMHGTAAGIYSDILTTMFAVDSELRMAEDPLFDGDKPEPVEENLNELMQLVTFDGRDSIGIAFDGDGDRLAVIDERGRFLRTHEIFCLLLQQIVSERGPGIVITSVSFSGLVERVATQLGCSVLDVPVGYKHISKAMLEHGAIIGGEESGGTGFGHYLPERDALLMAIMILHARQSRQERICEMVDSLYESFGRPVYLRHDVALSPDYDRAGAARAIGELAGLASIGGDAVLSSNGDDGMKLRTARGWALARISGTEPLLRLYCESDSEDSAQSYVESLLKSLSFAGH